jgi:hypothetical protein
MGIPRERKKGVTNAKPDVYVPKKEWPGSSSVCGIKGYKKVIGAEHPS